eukprot:942112-Alexandrium_andersonii.AAC.1
MESSLKKPRFQTRKEAKQIQREIPWRLTPPREAAVPGGAPQGMGHVEGIRRGGALGPRGEPGDREAGAGELHPGHA